MSAMSFANRVAYRVLVIACLAVAVLGTPTYAASFDCAKAQTRVEKFVCNDPFISKLDSQLGAVYDKDISKANPEQKARLIAEQRHWMSFTRAACKTQTCFKHAYWSRLAELETFYLPHSPLYKHESDKMAAIKKILATTLFYPDFVPSKRVTCGRLFSAVKSMNRVHFVEPMIRTQSYEDPVLNSLRRRVARECKTQFPYGAPIDFSYLCMPMDMSSRDENKSSNGLDICRASYGLPPFKVYRIPPVAPHDRTRYIFYSDNTYGPLNSDTHKPHLNAAGSAGFFTIIPGCGKEIDEGLADGGVPPNYSSIIKYDGNYYYLLLTHMANTYWLSINPVGHNASCSWTTFK